MTQPAMQTSARDYRARPPAYALALGYSGLIPFVGLSLMVWLGSAELAALALNLLQPYAIAILAFMGGVHWGLAMVNRLEGKPLANAQMAASVVPALFAVATSLLPTEYALLALCAGFAGLLAYDLYMVRRNHAPAWYPKLRWPLTLVLIFTLTLAAYATF